MEQKEKSCGSILSDWCNLAGTCIFNSPLYYLLFRSIFNLPGSIPVLGWLLIFNTLIAGLITSFINARPGTNYQT